jgi:hypothetical protein
VGLAGRGCATRGESKRESPYGRVVHELHFEHNFHNKHSLCCDGWAWAAGSHHPILNRVLQQH